MYVMFNITFDGCVVGIFTGLNDRDDQSFSLLRGSTSETLVRASFSAVAAWPPRCGIVLLVTTAE